MQAYWFFLSLSFWWLFWIFFGNLFGDIQDILFFVWGVFISSLGLLFFLKKYHFLLLTGVLGIFVGVWYGFWHSMESNYKYQLLEPYYEKHISAVWTIQQIQKKDQNGHSYKVDIESINGQDFENIAFLVKVSPAFSPDFKQKILISWKLDKVDNFSQKFDYKKYLQTQGMYGIVSYADIEKSGTGEYFAFQKYIFDFKEKILQAIYHQFPQKEALLLAGILLWVREEIPEDMKNDFNNSGLTHLMAVSGFNITILIFFVLFLGKYLPVFLRVFLVTLVIVWFTLLVWDAVPVLRASIMGLLSYYILMMWRQSDALSVLLFTASVLVGFNPLILNYDVSFHLSFLAVIGLLYFQEFWRKLCFFLPKFFAIQESFVLTLAAMTPTLPIMIFTFWQVSIFAPVANMLVGGMMPIIMFFWWLTLLVGVFSQTLAYYVWYGEYFLLASVNGVAHFFGNLEFSVWKYDAWERGVYWEITYFLLLIFCILFFQYKKTPD